ncbi:hypothetical protein V5O48_002341 [Marasmius crinis-equi]|uniref:Uncharacterized protein n=1 Tax=Marasmius crinis-equi TaxID=585013 RepID=A0ABR3FWD5_9AGAR
MMDYLPKFAPVRLTSKDSGAVILVALSSLFLLYLQRLLSTKPTTKQDSKPSAKDLTINADREWGDWAPVSFSYPEIPSYTEKLSEIKPIPYRPFRWGQYHVTMGIRDMPWGDWIEIDRTFPLYFAIRNHRIQSRGENVIRIMPDRPGIVKSAGPAAVELVHELAAYVTKRYPDAFIATRDSFGVIKSVRIRIHPIDLDLCLPRPLCEHGQNTLLREVTHEEAERSMRIAALITQDDLALMVEGTDGRYYFQGGAIIIPGSWRIRDKIGMPLEEIHVTGRVPQYQEKLHVGMERFFRRLPVHKPVIRNNYSIQLIQPEHARRKGNVPTDIPPRKEDEDLLDPSELAWATTANGDEDDFAHGRWHPDGGLTVSPETLQFRTERQTLRRLPLSGAVVFGIRTYQMPLIELGKEPGVPARLASAMRSWPEGVARYKGRDDYGSVMLEYLDRCANEQKLAGGEELEKSAEKGYPY